MALHQCPCGLPVDTRDSFHRGFDLVTATGVPEYVYVHFCTIPCRNAWIKEAPIYVPPPPPQPARIPSWGRGEYY